MIYQFFKRHASNPLVATAAYAWLLVSGRLRARRRLEKPSVCPAGRTAVKAAVICDQLTFEAFRRESLLEHLSFALIHFLREEVRHSIFKVS